MSIHGIYEEIKAIELAQQIHKDDRYGDNDENKEDFKSTSNT
jgi:hypothetical protein